MSQQDSDVLAHLVRSLDELEAERAAGDLTDADFEVLSETYTVRIADEMRRLAGGSTPGPNHRGRSWLWVAAGVCVFAIGAGLLVARSAGERGVNDALTGSINESPRQQTFRCQQLGSSGQMVESLECFDQVLTADPDNVEALTYRGWYLVLTTSAAEQAGQDEQAIELMASAISYLDQAVEIDPTFPDARAFRSVVYERLGQPEAVCDEIDALLALDPPEFFVNQTSGLAQRNNCGR